MGPSRTLKDSRCDLSRYRLHSLPFTRINIIINNLQADNATNLAYIASLHGLTFAIGNDKFLKWQLLKTFELSNAEFNRNYNY